MLKKFTAISLSAISAFCSLVFSACNTESKEPQELSVEYKTADNLKDGAILQCFCWDFNTIKSSMQDIAAAGFSAIQTSPINECLEGENGGMQLYGDGKWYYHYQPTDYTIGNYQLGTEEQFKQMCDEAEKYGIRVLVDVVPNHTTPAINSINENLLNAVGGIDKLFHKGSQRDIADWGDRLQCTTYKMGGLPDVNTENPDFQNYFFKFINRCIELGADGFRYDTAKHIGLPDDEKEDDGYQNNFWLKAKSDVTNSDKLFVYGEVLQGNNDRIGEYIDTIGAATASSYGGKIRGCIINNDFNLPDIEDYAIGKAERNIVTWVESHDNYINDGSYTELDDRAVILAWSVITARKDGTPLFFDRPYGATAENPWGTMNRIGVSGSYIYKDPAVTAVNRFRTAMAGEDETLSNPDKQYSSIMIERGTRGAVIVTLSEELKTGFETSLADGEYTDRVDGKTVYTVKNGILTSEKSIPAYTSVVLYNEGYTEYAKTATVWADGVDDFNYEGESVQVVLKCSNARKAEYSIDGKEYKEYSDGEKITIKSEGDAVTTLELRGENEQGVKTYMKYCFTKYVEYEISGDDSVYFVKPSDWKDDISIIVSEADGSKTQTFKMTDNETSYIYTFDSSWISPKAVFTDGTNTYPADNKPMEITAEEVYRVE